VLLAALVIGLLISVLQVATQLHGDDPQLHPEAGITALLLNRAGAVDDPPDHPVRDLYDQS